MTFKQTEHDVNKTGFSLEDIEGLIATTQNYFLLTGDRDSRVWIFRPDEPSLFLRSSIQLGDGKFSIFIADPFAGLQPILLSYKTLTTNEPIQIPFRPTAILDSNVVTYLHQYVTSGSLLDLKQRKVVHEFLRFVVQKKLDYNPFFYYIETTHFLSTGELIADPAIMAMYAEEYGAETIDEIAPRYARAMVTPRNPRLDGLSKLIYAALLKIGLIHKTNKRTLMSKYHELLVFMQEVLKIGMGTERMVALAYFTGKFDNFIPIQKGAVVAKVHRRLKAAAWDLVLLRLPARLLAVSPDDEISVGYVCTSDRALWQIARTAKLEAVTKMMPKTPEGVPVLSYDPSPLELNITPALMEQIFEADTDWQQRRIPYLTGGADRIPYEILLTLIDELEQQVNVFCSAE